MAINTFSVTAADVENFIADEVLPLAVRQLVLYRFGEPLTLPKGRGFTYTATRFNRIPLPFAPLSEGVPPVGEVLTITQVTATALQWGDLVRLTDLMEIGTKHPVMEQANYLIGLQIGETLDRNTFNSLMAGTQVNYVNSRGSRAALQAGDVLDAHTVNRTVVALKQNGAPRYMGDEMTDSQLAADTDELDASGSPAKKAHYVVIASPIVGGDFSENSTVAQTWTYSDPNRLYNGEIGQWRGTRWCESNMMSSFFGVAQVNPTPAAGGSLAAGNYFIVVTASDTQNQYESRIYQVSASTTVGANGALSVVLPALSGFTFNVYVGTTASPANLGLSASGPTSGPLQGQATQLTPGTTVVITGLGTAQVPPAAPATGVTVWPTFVLGRGAYGQVKLDDVTITWLADADKSDPLNQQRIVGWKTIYGTLIENNLFFARIESSSQFTATYG